MIIFVCLFAICYFQVTSSHNIITVEVDHKYGKMTEFVPRASIKINGQTSNEVQYKPISPWPVADQLAAANDGAWYCVRTKVQPLNAQSNNYVSSCMPLCPLLLTDLSDVLTISLDSNRQHVVGISVQLWSKQSVDKYCQNLNENSLFVDSFNTSVRIIEPIEGPIPDTQAYLQKLEREKQEKVQGEQGDNRSFIGKYWMYIVPVVIVIMLSGAMNPEAQQQGR